MLQNKYFKILAISLISISFYMFLRNINFFCYAAGRLISVVSPIITGFVFAFLNNILLKKFEKKFKNRKVCLTLSVMMIFSVIAAFVFLILPELKNAVTTLIKNFPSYVIGFNRFTDMLNRRFGFSLPEFSESIQFSSINPGGIINTVSGAVSSAANIIIGFILSVYILLDKENFIKAIQTAVGKIFKKNARKIFKLAAVSDIIFTNYIIGQLTEALILGLLTLFGMIVFGLPYAVMISGVVCVTSLVPVFGAVTGGAVGFLLILSENPVKSVWFVVFILILQQIEGNVIYPKVMGKSVGLPPSAVLVAVTLGFGLFGIFGIILSVPCASVVYYYIWDGKTKT